MKPNNFGFSLAEIVVATGILGIVSLGTVQIMQTTSKQSRKLIVDGASKNVLDKIKNLFQNPDSCKATLYGKTVSSDTPLDNTPAAACNEYPNAANISGTNGVKDALGNLKFQKCQRVSEGKGADGVETITIGDINLKQFVERDTTGANDETINYGYNSSTNTFNTGQAGMLIVEVALISKAFAKAPQRVQRHRIFVNVVVDSATKVVSCYAANVYAESTCAANGGVIDPVSGRCASSELCFFDGSNSKCFTAWPKLDGVTTCTPRTACLAGEIATGFDGADILCCKMKVGNKSYDLN